MRAVIYLALCGLLVRDSTAAVCTTGNAIPIQSIFGSDSGGGGGINISDLITLVKRRPTPDAAALATAALSLRARAQRSLACTAAEVCASDINGKLFCYNVATGGYHDDDNTVGNLITGDYTLADGRRGNLYSGPRPEVTGTGGGGKAGATTTPAAAAVTSSSAPRPASRTTTAADETILFPATPSPTASANGAGGSLRPALGGLLVGLGARLL